MDVRVDVPDEVKKEKEKILKQEFLDPRHAHNVIDGIRVGLDISALGFAARGSISTETGFKATASVEGVCALLATAIFIGELVNIISARCGADADEYKRKQAFNGGHFIYLSFRIILLMANYAGAALIASDIPASVNVPTTPSLAPTSSQIPSITPTLAPTTLQTPGIKTDMGIILVAISLFANRALNARYKLDSNKKHPPNTHKKVVEPEEDKRSALSLNSV